MRTRVRLAASLTAALALSTGGVAAAADTSRAATATPGAAPGAAASAPAARAVGATHTVTLVTGDRVQVTKFGDGRTGVAITPGASREKVAFVKEAVGDRVTVLPSDAAPLVAAGRVDPRLFDVTGLIEQRYDDAASATLPLIVTGAGGASARQARGVVAAGGAQVVRELASVDGFAVQTSRTDTARFWQSVTAPARDGRHLALAGGIGRLWLDGRVRADLDKSVPQIGAPQAWQAGYTGKGVKVAVLDTGYDQTHPDLARRVVAAQNFSNEPSARDGHGHGAHVASTIGVSAGWLRIDVQTSSDPDQPFRLVRVTIQGGAEGI